MRRLDSLRCRLSRKAAVCYDSDALTSAATLQRGDSPAIAYDIAGDGPPVVFVHGMTSFRQSWNPVTDLLVQDFTCVRLDLRGHGASSAASEYSTVY